MTQPLSLQDDATKRKLFRYVMEEAQIRKMDLCEDIETPLFDLFDRMKTALEKRPDDPRFINRTKNAAKLRAFNAAIDFVMDRSKKPPERAANDGLTPLSQIEDLRSEGRYDQAIHALQKTAETLRIMAPEGNDVASKMGKECDLIGKEARGLGSRMISYELSLSKPGNISLSDLRQSLENLGLIGMGPDFFSPDGGMRGPLTFSLIPYATMNMRRLLDEPPLTPEERKQLQAFGPVLKRDGVSIFPPETGKKVSMADRESARREAAIKHIADTIAKDPKFLLLIPAAMKAYGSLAIPDGNNDHAKEQLKKVIRIIAESVYDNLDQIKAGPSSARSPH